MSDRDLAKIALVLGAMALALYMLTRAQIRDLERMYDSIVDQTFVPFAT
jgi:hypothetical protein